MTLKPTTGLPNAETDNEALAALADVLPLSGIRSINIGEVEELQKPREHVQRRLFAVIDPDVESTPGSAQTPLEILKAISLNHSQGPTILERQKFPKISGKKAHKYLSWLEGNPEEKDTIAAIDDPNVTVTMAKLMPLFKNNPLFHSLLLRQLELVDEAIRPQTLHTISEIQSLFGNDISLFQEVLDKVIDFHRTFKSNRDIIAELKCVYGNNIVAFNDVLQTLNRLDQVPSSLRIFFLGAVLEAKEVYTSSPDNFTIVVQLLLLINRNTDAVSIYQTIRHLKHLFNDNLNYYIQILVLLMKSAERKRIPRLRLFLQNISPQKIALSELKSVANSETSPEFLTKTQLHPSSK